MGSPSRSLKFEIDFRARRIAGRCPEIWVSSTTAASSSFWSWIASPTPMLITIFSKRGACIVLWYLNFSTSAGRTFSW